MFIDYSDENSVMNVIFTRGFVVGYSKVFGWKSQNNKL